MRLTIVTLVLVVFLAVGTTNPQSGLAQSPSPLSNQQAADKIAASLSERFPAYDIYVKYRNGQLQLEGEVASESMARDVVEHVRNVGGVVVSAVDNQLTIGRRGVGFIPANPSNRADLPVRRSTSPFPSPARTAPPTPDETLTISNEAVRPTPAPATPSPATTRNNVTNRTSPTTTAPVPMPARAGNTGNVGNIDEPLLIANADRNAEYPNALNSPYTPRPTRSESGSYPNDNYYYNYTSNNNARPNYVSVQDTNPVATRSAFRQAVSAPLPLYAPSANAGNMQPPPYYVANNPVPMPPNNYPAAIPAPTYGYQPYYGATAPMPSAYNRPNLPPYAWPSYATYPNYAQVTYPRSYSVQSWPYIGPFYPYPQAPMAWRQVTLKFDHARWWLDFNDGEPSGPLSPLFRQPTGYRY
ncbi:MAG: BON domain-containing protein [Planctomycetaceae bacterium]|jgi:hypothetical protein|nr:BON domain-containing protein [Planctomycetaceae bacterium]